MTEVIQVSQDQTISRIIDESNKIGESLKDTNMNDKVDAQLNAQPDAIKIADQSEVSLTDRPVGGSCPLSVKKDNSKKRLNAKKPKIKAKPKNKSKSKSDSKSDLKSDSKNDSKTGPKPKSKESKTKPKELKGSSETKDLTVSIIQESDNKRVEFMVFGKINAGKSTFLNYILEGKYSLIKARATIPKITEYILTDDPAKAQSPAEVYQKNLDFENEMAGKKITCLHKETYHVLTPELFGDKLKNYEVVVYDVPGFYPDDDEYNRMIKEWIRANFKKFRGIFFVIDGSVDGCGLESKLQKSICNDVIENINNLNKKVHVFNIINKFDKSVDVDLIEIKENTTNIIKDVMKNISHDIVPMNSYRAYAYGHVLKHGFVGLDDKYLDDVATRELSSSWKLDNSERNEELLNRMKKKISERDDTDASYELSCGVRSLKHAVVSFLENIDEVYGGKLELILSDRNIDAGSPEGFEQILRGYEEIIRYVKTPGRYDDSSDVSRAIEVRLKEVNKNGDAKSLEVFFETLKKYNKTIIVFANIHTIRKKINNLIVSVLNGSSQGVGNYLESWLNYVQLLDWVIPRKTIINILSSHYGKCENEANYKSGTCNVNVYGDIIIKLVENYDESNDEDSNQNLDNKNNIFERRKLIMNFIYNFLQMGHNGNLDKHQCCGVKLTLRSYIVKAITHEILKSYKDFETEYHQIYDLQYNGEGIPLSSLKILSGRDNGKSIIDVTASFLVKMLEFLKKTPIANKKSKKNDLDNIFDTDDNDNYDVEDDDDDESKNDCYNRFDNNNYENEIEGKEKENDKDEDDDRNKDRENESDENEEDDEDDEGDEDEDDEDDREGNKDDDF
jgi:GTPase Era involved in 16S rRNA processing